MWDEFQTAAERAARDRARSVVLNAIGYEGQEPSIQQPPPPHFDEQAQYLLFYGIIPFIAWCIRSCFAIVFLIAISIGTYASIWKAIMQGLDVQSHQIYFDYSQLSTGGPMIPTGIVDLRSIRRAPWIHSCGESSSHEDHHSSQHVEYACINSDNEEMTYRVGGDEMGNKIIGEKAVLEPGKRYFFELSLTLPESDINKQLGVFMVNVALRSVDRSLLALSKQHSLLPFESIFVSLVRKTIYILPLASGILSETKTITLHAFDKYCDANIKKPVSLVEVSLEVPNSEAFPATMRTIQIQSAELRYGKEMNPIQAIIRKWHYLCAIIGISVIFLCYVWIVLKFLRRRAAKHRAETHPYGSLFGSDDESDDLSNNNDQWSGVDIEILDDDENDSGVWEPIDAKGRRRTTNENDDKQKKSAPNDHVVSDDDDHYYDDESVSMKQNKSPPSMDEAEWDAFLNFVGKDRGGESTVPPPGKLGDCAAEIDEPLFAEMSSHDNKEKCMHSQFNVKNGANSRIKEELKMADMVMRGNSKLDTCSDRD